MTVSAWLSRFLALVLLISVVGVLQLLVGQPLLDSFIETRGSIGRTQETLARYRQLNASQAQMHGRLDKVQAAFKNEGRLLRGASDQLAGADLQNRLKYLIETNNAELGSMQLLPVREEEGFRRVSVTISFTATTASLRSMLYEIETQTPYLFVEKLELRQSRNLANASNFQDEDKLKVRLDVYGYMLIE